MLVLWRTVGRDVCTCDTTRIDMDTYLDRKLEGSVESVVTENALEFRDFNEPRRILMSRNKKTEQICILK